MKKKAGREFESCRPDSEAQLLNQKPVKHTLDNNGVIVGSNAWAAREEAIRL